MALITLTMNELVNRALFDLVDPGGQGLRVVTSTTIDADDTSLSLVSANGVNPSDVIELGDELLLVTAKSSDAVPVLTVARGYYNTAPESHASGKAGHVNPTYPRRRIAEGVRRAFSRMEALGVQKIVTVTKQRVPGFAYCEMPVDCRDVLQVAYWGTDGRLLPISGWRFFDHLPTGKWSTGKTLNLPNYVADEDELEITYRAPYRWSTYPTDPDPSATIGIPEGAEELPALYAAAWLMSSREISRAELDRSEEWNQTMMASQGVTAAMVRARWQEFYRALDEARRLNQVPTPILYHTRPKI